MAVKDVERLARIGHGRPSSRFVPPPRTTQWAGVFVLDWLGVAIATAGLAVGLHGRASARLAPLLSLIFPIVRLALSADYRRRAGGWAAKQWRSAQAYASGTGPIPWRFALAFIAAPFFVFDVSHHGFLGTFDTRPVVATAVSLIREGDIDLQEFEGLRPPLLHGRDGSLCYSFQVVNGRIVSTYPSGMVPFALATVGPAWLLGADLDSLRSMQHLEKITAAMVAAVALGLFFLTSARLGSASAAAVATAFLASGSALFTTVGLGLWQHGGVVVWLLAALLVEFATRGEPSTRGSLFQGFALAQMLSCRPTAALLVALFGVWVIARSPRRGLVVAAGGAVGLAPWIGFYEWIYGSPFGPSTVTSSVSGRLWCFFQPWPIMGVVFSPGRGIFVYQPWGVLAAAAIAWPWLRRSSGIEAGPNGWAAFCATAVVLHVILISAWWEWPGGYCYGSRLATDVVPLLALLATPAVSLLLKRRAGATLLVALGVVGLLVQLPCVVNDAHRWSHDLPRRHWSWSHAPFFYRAPR